MLEKAAMVWRRVLAVPMSEVAMDSHEGFCRANCGSFFAVDGGVYFGFVVLGGMLTLLVAIAISFLCGRRYENFRPMVSEAPVTRASVPQPQNFEMGAASGQRKGNVV